MVGGNPVIWWGKDKHLGWLPPGELSDRKETNESLGGCLFSPFKHPYVAHITGSKEPWCQKFMVSHVSIRKTLILLDENTSSSSPHGKWQRSWLIYSSVQFSSVTQSCLTLCIPMHCSTSGLPVHHQLPEFTQTHVHGVSDAIQPSHPLSSPSPPTLNLSHCQGKISRERNK